jgi:uncharacterized protein (DUF2267 family)
LWLEEIQEKLEWNDPEKSYKALRIVLHTLRDRLPAKEVTDLSAQLPMLVRGMYFEGWNPNHKPSKLKHADEFVDEVNSHFPEFDYTETEYTDPQEITRVVFTTLAKHVSSGEIEDVIGFLPKGLRELWD